MASYLLSPRLCTVFALLIGLSLCVGHVGAQEHQTTKEKTAKNYKPTPITKTASCSDDVTLQGTLEEEIAVPACGAFTVGLVMRFKMVDLKTNTFFDCAMVILCPNIYGKGFFRMGKKYRFLCKGQVDSALKRYNEYLIINKYAKLQLRTYVAQKVQMVE